MEESSWNLMMRMMVRMTQEFPSTPIKKNTRYTVATPICPVESRCSRAFGSWQESWPAYFGPLDKVVAEDEGGGELPTAPILRPILRPIQHPA